MSRGAIWLRLLLALLGAAAGAAGCAALARAAVGTARGQRLDQLVLSAGQNDTGPLSRVVFPVLNTVTVPVVIAALVVAALLALLQRRLATVLHIVVLVGGAAATTQILKHLVIERASLADGLEVTPNSFPSGHTTIAAAVAVALTLAAPHHVRSAVAIISAAWTGIAGIGTIAGGWHRPSDVLGALLVVAAWSSAVLAVDAIIALLAAHRARAGAAAPPPGLPVHRPPRTGRRVLASLGIVGVVGGVLVLAQVPTPLELADRSAQMFAYAGSAAALAGAACCLLAWVLLLHVPAARALPAPRGREDPAPVTPAPVGPAPVGSSRVTPAPVSRAPTAPSAASPDQDPL